MLEQSATPFFPADNPAATAHIALLQGIINRLAGNSASCKTWCLTLVGALLSLAAATHVPAIVGFALIPVVIFGFLDAMYLAQEKAYRDLYVKIVSKMRDRTYDLKCAFAADARMTPRDFICALLSWSVWPVYLSLIALYVVAGATDQIAKLAIK